jgi:hypothetical protein
VKNINIAYSQSIVNDVFKNLLGPRNVVCTYFPKGSVERNLHDGICNLGVLNLIVYKQYMRQNIKMLHTYVKFSPRAESLGGPRPPADEMFKEFSFVEVNTAITNALTAIANTPATAPPLETVIIEQVAHLIQEAKVKIKADVKHDIEQMKDDIVQETQT